MPLSAQLLTRPEQATSGFLRWLLGLLNLEHAAVLFTFKDGKRELFEVVKNQGIADIRSKIVSEGDISGYTKGPTSAAPVQAYERAKASNPEPYRIFSNNCQHHATRILHGEAKSWDARFWGGLLALLTILAAIGLYFHLRRKPSSSAPTAT